MEGWNAECMATIPCFLPSDDKEATRTFLKKGSLLSERHTAAKTSNPEPAIPCTTPAPSPVTVDVPADDIPHVPEPHPRPAGGNGRHHCVMSHLDEGLADWVNLEEGGRGGVGI